MEDESPFRSPQVVEHHEPLDDRSQRILQWRRAHRRLELGIPAFAFTSIMTLAPIDQVLAFLAGDLSAWPAFLGSWVLGSFIVSGIILFALLPLFSFREILAPLLLAWIPLLPIVGLILAMRKVQAPLRAEGLKFGRLGPSEKLLVQQLRHEDGTPVDPKTFGVKR
ncbi:hypothetical protein [Bremerella alba]|uniref:Uncharacterized protein n=1 Tax=Bremerella alba TaxID=980252 RepID=A0A7V8V4I7_9BACT|nr:hypothetical protein [Bremerella alba]MBA2114809.1 hypothetical protein [Bremerella alba]